MKEGSRKGASLCEGTPLGGPGGKAPLLGTSKDMLSKDLDMWRVWVRRGGCIRSWWGNRREGDHWGDLGVDGWIILGRISRRWAVGIWTGLG